MELIGIIVQVLIAWVYGHVAEYSIHRWVLHGIGKKRGHPLSFHFVGHHGTARRNAMHDEMYGKFPELAEPSGKELIYLFLIIALHAPIAAWLPWAYATMVWSAASYYYVHRKSHVNVEWARHILPWHYDHHMGRKQDANYGVRLPWVDHVLGTRVPYYGTKTEKRDHYRRLMKYKMGKLNEIRSHRAKRKEY